MSKPISSQLLASLRPSKSFRNNKPNSAITSVDFDDGGRWAIASCEDETLQLYDCKQGKHSKTLYSKKYGVHLARFTHHSTNVVYASTKEDDTIRYLSLHDNLYVRYFKGHKKKVNCLEVSPLNDQFLSSSWDNTVRLWDLRSSHCHGLLNIRSPSLTTFDPAGIIFAVANHPLESSICLYDLRNYDKEPFSTFRLPPGAGHGQIADWTKIEFSNDGKLILIGTRGDSHYILDSFTGELKIRLYGHAPTMSNTPTSGDVCFTPDGGYVLAGSADKSVMVWDLHASTRDGALAPQHILDTYNCGVPRVLQFSPKNHLLVSADKEVVSVSSISLTIRAFGCQSRRDGHNIYIMIVLQLQISSDRDILTLYIEA